MKKHRHYLPSYLFLTYLLIWFCLNLLCLETFPGMHTDEPWLSGLSRHMAETGRWDVTEPFYDLHERNPHAIKLLFHLLQRIYIAAFGYSLTSVRLLSLTGGLVTLLLFYSLLDRLVHHDNVMGQVLGIMTWLPLLITVWLSWDIQFLYASHLARQEIWMTALMTGSLLVLIHPHGQATRSKWLFALPDALSGIIIGLAVGFHPNAFIIAWPAGFYLLLQTVTGDRSPRDLLLFVLTTGLGAALFAGISFSFNPRFIQDYAGYGAPLGVLDSPDRKILKLIPFYIKLFKQIGGTYYLPPIKYNFLIFTLFILLLFLPLGSKKKGELRVFRQLTVTGFIGINLGLIIIGKFSQPSAVFLTPLLFLAAAGVFIRSTRRPHSLILLLPLLMGLSLFISVKEINRVSSPEKESYTDYLENISLLLPADARVLGGLSLEYYLDYHGGSITDGLSAGLGASLYHWRNLAELPREEGSFAAYIKDRDITHIVVPAEIPYIYETRPQWNTLYGNPAFWYPQMEDYLSESCELVGGFPSPGYGIRIEAYRYRREWPVQVYRVLKDDSSRE